MMRLLLVVVALSLLPGCALIAAGVGGAVIESQHRDWCRYHPMESNCWQYQHSYGRHP